MDVKKHLFATSRIFIFILLQLSLIFDSQAQINNLPTSSCPVSSCGNLGIIKYPFRLKTDPISCGFNNTFFELDCQNNRTIIDASPGRYFGPYIASQPNQTSLVTRDISTWYYLEEINFYEHSMRLVDPGIIRGNLSSCPLHYYSNNDWPLYSGEQLWRANVPVAFIHCLSPVNSTKYVEAPFCGNRSTKFANSSKFYSYVLVGETQVSDLEESCTMDRVDWISTHGSMKGNYSSLASIYDGLAYGFTAADPHRGECERNMHIRFMHFQYVRCCYVNPRDPKHPKFRCVSYSTEVGLAILRFVIGFPLMVGLVVHKWRGRHRCTDKTIEEFLQVQCNHGPIKYTYREIKKMTDNFKQKLGEGGSGSVYKGKLRSGPYVAVKMMKQSIASEEQFISEVGTIGRIHHVNIVQLIGFCVEHSNYALVYEFLPNSSLDRYIFNRHGLVIQALTYGKMFEIALGVASGINYLHCGCDMQILHFDIKPHNVLLDENFNPKISDFGLAQLHPPNESFINLTAARGTMGYMAPEMFYKNIGRGISHKADIYSFGMMLMEMASRRKNMIPFVEDSSQIYFPLWVYDHLCAGNEIDIKDATEEERKLMKKIIIVALWCIQIRPSDRPAMNKVVKMLESDFEPQMPPKPFVAPRDAMAIDDLQTSRSYSIDFITFDLAR